MTIPIKALVAAAAVVVVAVVGYSVLPRSPSIGGLPTPVATLQPTPTPGATPRVLGLDDVGGSRGPARLALGAPFLRPLELTLTVPWRLDRYSAGEASFQRPGDGATYVGFFSVSRVYQDPCHPATGVVDLLSLGRPSLDGQADLETALRSMTGFTATPVTDRTIGGLPARGFTVTNSIDTATCTDPPWLSLFDPIGGEVARTVGGTSEPMWIVDLNGGRTPTGPTDAQRPLLIVAEPGADAPAGQGLLDAILESLTIE